MRTLRIAFLSVLFAHPLACGGGETLDNENATTVAALALAETAGADDEGSLGALAFSEVPAASAPGKADAATTEERLARFKDYVTSKISCANTVEAAGAVTLTFGKDCTWAGKRWSGEATFTYDTPNSVTVDFAGLSVRGATTTGTFTVTRKGERHVTLEGSRSSEAAGVTVDATVVLEAQWDEDSLALVSAKRTKTVDGASRTYTALGVHWVRGERAPETGTMSWLTRAGKTYTIAFARTSEGALEATVTSPTGTTTVPVDDLG